MRLTDWEDDRLTIFLAAELARRHRAQGLLLNAPEATALMCDAMLEAARAGADYGAIEQAGRDAVRTADCLEGTPALVDEVRLEVLMDEGTRLVVLLEPLGAPGGRGGLVPGEVVVSDAPLPAPPDRRRLTMRVMNTSERTVRVSSHYPFHRVNQRLDFDREAARGYRLALPAGETLRWAPGEARDVELVAYGGAGSTEPAGTP
ncbi:MAG: urease subunit beta [Candidatus Limnocylindrales bacterium]